MSEPTKEALLATEPGTFDTQTLAFEGLRGDPTKHLERHTLEAALTALPMPPRDEGRVDLLLARGSKGERVLHREAWLTVAAGMPDDRWAGNGKYGPDYQLATTRTDFARVIANGQPIMLHGDNLFLTLDLSADNLPVGSLLALGTARVRVTPVPHNGCKKWVQRFGLAAIQLNMAAHLRALHLRGIYLQVVEDGLVRVGDAVKVIHRATQTPNTP
jgi:hypothetical protein